MSDIVLRIQGTSAAASAAVKSFRDQLASLREMVVSVGTEQKQQSTTAVEAAKAQIAAEKEKVVQYRAEIAAIKEVTASYAKGSDERKIAVQSEIAMQRKLQAALGETAAVASKTAGAGSSSRRSEESGFARGAASRSGVVGAGMSALAGPGFLAGAIIGGGLDLSIKAAKQEEAAQANLRNALKDTGTQRQESRKQINEYLAAEEHATGFTRDQVTQTMSMLIRSTGSLTTARKDEAVMANIARARQTDLSGAYMLVVRASEGNVGSLKRLGIEVPKVTKYEDELRDAHVKATSALKEHAKALDLAATKTEVMKAVTQKFAGDSAAYMHTFGGETATLRNTFHDLEVELGDKAIPMLTNLFGWIQREIQAVKESKSAHDALRQIVDILRVAWSGAVTVVKTAEELLRNKLIRTLALAAGAMWALNAAVSANPWVALTVAALLAVGEIQKHWSAISGWFDKLWDTIRGAGETAWNGIVQLAKGAVYLMLEYATSAIQGILKVASYLPIVGGSAKSALNDLQTYIDGWKPDFSNVVGDFGAAGGAAGQAFYDNVKKFIDASASNAATATSMQSGGQDVRLTQILKGSGGRYVAEAPSGSVLLPGSIGKGKGASVAIGAAQFIGTPYSWGGGHGSAPGPTQGRTGVGLDCSGLARAALAQAGIVVPAGDANALMQNAPYRPSVGELKPGDLVFYEGPHPGHVAVYIGDGKVIHAPHTGESVQIASVTMMKITGTARYWGGKDQAAPGPTTSGGDAAAKAAVANLNKQFQADLAAAPRTGAKGLSKPSETTLLGSITAMLGTVPKGQLDSVQREAVAQIKKIRDSLHVGMSADELAKDRVALAKWGKALRDDVSAEGRKFTESGIVAKFHADLKTALQAFKLEVLPAGQESKLKGQIAAFQKLVRQAAQDGQISPTELRNIKASWSAMSSEMTAAASAVKTELQQQFQNTWSAVANTVDRGITEAWQQTQTTFARETQAALTQMQRSTAAQITQMQRGFQAQMTQFDRATTAGLSQFVVAETPQEKALKDFQAQRDAATLADTQAQEQSSLTAAIASGDPAQIKSAQQAIQNTLEDIQQAALQKAADDSRAAQDAKTQQQQQAYQDERDQLKQALTDQEAAREQSYQDQADAAAQAYQDQRDAQWQHLNDMHDDQVTAFGNDLADWSTWIQNKQRTYAQFLAWLAQNPISAALAGQLPTSFNAGGAAGAFSSLAAKVGEAPTAGKAKAMWEGGVAFRPTTRMMADQGPEAVLPLTSVAGARAIRQLADAINVGGGGGTTTNVYGTFLGATERQVSRALATVVTPGQKRNVTYPAPPL